MGTGAVSRYKVYKWLVIYPDTECCKRHRERIRVYPLLYFVLLVEASKNRDEFIYFIVRVRFSLQYLIIQTYFVFTSLSRLQSLSLD